MTNASYFAPLRPRLATSLLLTLALAACSAAPYQAPNLVAPATFDGAGSTPAKTTTQPWWLSFQDPALDGLITTGLAQNLSVLQAVERVQEARALANVTAASEAPQIGVTASAAITEPDGSSSVTAEAASTNLSWVVDLFGRVSSAKATSNARLDAAYASADVARITLTGAVASAYVDLRYYQNRIALTRESIQSRQKTADLVQSAFAAGASTKLDTLRADQLIAIADAQLPALEVGYATALNRLATLTGQPSAQLARDLQRGASQPVPHFRANVGVPADVLRHRPDVIVAERDMAAAYAAVGVAKADLYPSLTLGGTITAAGTDGAWGNTMRSFGPSVTLPLFNRDKIQNAVTAAQSRAKQADLAWQATVRGAVEEIQNALAAYSRDGRNMAAQERLTSISVQTLDLARSSFEIGQGDFLSVLEAERTLLDAKASLADATRARAFNFIRLSTATADGVTAN